MPLSRLQREEQLRREVAEIDTRLAELAVAITTGTNADAAEIALRDKATLETKRAACLAAADALAAEIADYEREEGERRKAKWETELQPQALVEINERADLIVHRLESVADAYEALVACENRWKDEWVQSGRPGERAFPSVARRSLADMLGLQALRPATPSHGPRARRIHAALTRSALQLTRDFH